MSDVLREHIAEQFRQDAMAEAHEQMLWRDFVEADRVARESLDISDARYARKAYARYLRLSLTDPERRVIALEDQVISLRAEIAMLKTSRRRPWTPFPLTSRTMEG